MRKYNHLRGTQAKKFLKTPIYHRNGSSKYMNPVLQQTDNEQKNTEHPNRLKSNIRSNRKTEWSYKKNRIPKQYEEYIKKESYNDKQKITEGINPNLQPTDNKQRNREDSTQPAYKKNQQRKPKSK